MKDVKTWTDRLIMCALWILATTVGVTVGFNIASFIFFGEGGLTVFWRLFIVRSLGGAVIGLLQWLILRRWVKDVGWWIAGTAAGFGLLYLCSITGPPPPFRSFLPVRVVFPFVSGGLMGTVQWLVLRPKLNRAAWWIPSSMVGWGVALLITSSSPYYRWGNTLALLPTLAVGAVVGIATGTGLALLVTQETGVPLLKLKPVRWQWMALAVVLGLLIPSELAFQRDKHRGWTTYTSRNAVRSIAVAPDGALWFTGGGVAKFDGETWVRYRGSGMPYSSISAVALAPDGVLWLGSYSGLSRFDGDTFSTFNADGTTRPIHGPDPNGVTAIAVTRDGAVWFDTPGNKGSGVCRFDGENWTTYTADDGLAGNSVKCIAEASDGAMWFGTETGVSRFDGESWITYTTDDGLVGNSVRCIAAASDGAMWFGTGWGVSRFDGESWTTYTTNDGLASNYIQSIAAGPDGVLWFNTGRGGISRFDGQSWATYTPANSGLAGPPWGSPRSLSISSLAVDSQGRVWVGTRDGLSVLDERMSLPARPFHVLAAAWGTARVGLGIAALVLLTIVCIALFKQQTAGRKWPLGKSPSILLCLGVGFVLSLLVGLAVISITGQISHLTWLVPISLGLLVSLLTSFAVYIVKRELTTTFAVVVFMLATPAAFILVLSLGGFAQ